MSCMCGACMYISVCVLIFEQSWSHGLFCCCVGCRILLMLSCARKGAVCMGVGKAMWYAFFVRCAGENNVVVMSWFWFGTKGSDAIRFKSRVVSY